jgi:hypothetical protein
VPDTSGPKVGNMGRILEEPAGFGVPHPAAWGGQVVAIQLALPVLLAVLA